MIFTLHKTQPDNSHSCLFFLCKAFAAEDNAAASAMLILFSPLLHFSNGKLTKPEF